MWSFAIIVLLSIFPLDITDNQDVIRLDNPSFEGTSQDASTPAGWMPCGSESTPDILPGAWGVTTEPADGNTYLGLITRENGTWESVGQRLRKPLKANECYTFSIDLARSANYIGYDVPVKFQMWGADSRCAHQQLLAETKVVRHTNWRTYNFEIYPEKNINFIIIEARVANGIYFAYKGNLLLDHCSPFTSCARP